MKLICKCQHSLVTAHLAEDDGQFVFVCCRRGFEQALGRRLKVGEKVAVEIELDERPADLPKGHA